MGLFDDMEPQGSKTSSGLFDDLEAPKRNTGLAGDLGTDLKRGVQQLPGIVTGLLDIPVAAVTGRRMVSDGYVEIGKLTGFQPSKWAEEARQEYSTQRQAAQAEIDQVWEDGTPTEIVGGYLSNPGYVAGKVVESLPQMAAGGLAGRVALGAARGAGLMSAPTTAAQAARQAAIGAGVGEGAVVAGGTMEQIDDDVDARRAAAASLGAGVVGGALGYGGSRLAQKVGLIDAEGALAGGIQRATGDAPGLARRMTGGAVTEGLLEELPQSVQEQMWQNWAEQNPLMEGAARAGVEGALAGSALGAGVNVMPRGRANDAEADPAAEAGDPPPLVVTRGADPDLIQPIPTAENPAPAPVERPDPANGPLSAAASMLPSATPAPVPEMAGIGQPLEQQDQPGSQGRREQSAPASLVEARIREAIADVERRARLGGMTPVLAAERARLGGELLAMQQAAEEAQRDKPAIGDQRSDFYAGRNGFTSRSRDPWVNPANNRSSDPYNRFPGIDQVPPQPLEGELLTDALGEPAGQPAGQPGIGADFRPRLMREGELLGGELVPQGLRAGLGRGDTFDGQNRAMPTQPDARGMTGAVSPRAIDGELVGGDLQAQAERQYLDGRIIEGELSPREQRALTTTFRKRGAAELARKSLPAPDRYAVEEQGGAFAIRQLPPPAPSIAGREIDREWSEFAPESGTLAIPRAEMPQIKAEHRGAMVRFLNARGIQHEEQTVPATELKPTQAEFSRQKVEQAKGFTGGDRAILVSSDGHVLDGHHQWLAKREAGGEVRVIRLKAPIRDLLPVVAEFPSATQETGAQPMTIGRQPKAPKRGQRRTVDRDRDSVVQAVIRLGGITTQWKQDTTGDTVGNKNIPGVGALWSNKTGTSLDDMASLLDQHGYVPAGEMDQDGGVSWLQEAIRDELAGNPRYAPDSARQIEAAEQELLNRYAEAVARAIDEREAEYARIEAEYGPDAADDARSFDQAAIERDAQLDREIADAKAQQDTYLDGKPVDATAAAHRDDELRQADGRADRAERAEADAFALRQQTEAGLAEQDRQRQAREQAEAEALRKAEQKAQADAELNDFTLTGSDRPADVGAARGQNDLFSTQPVRKEAEEPSAQQDPVADAPPPAQEVSAGEIEPDKPKRRAKPASEKIDDTGDSLYWNRKNPWRGGGLKWEQIAGENEALRAKLVTKARVWAKPDWQAYLGELLPKLPEQQRDAAVLVARLTKQIYDALPAAPKDRTDKGLQAYIEVIERVRGASEALLQDGERHVALLNGLTRRSGDILSFARQVGTMPIFDVVFPEIAAGGRFQRGTPANDRGQVIGNKAIKAMQWSVADAGKALKDIKAGWPASQEAWQKQGLRVLSRDGLRAAGVDQMRGVYAAMIFEGRNSLATVRDAEGERLRFSTQTEADAAAQAELQSWGPYLLLDKRNRLVGGFDSEELAIEAARASVKREVKPSVRETPLADAEIQRVGTERRTAGQDVTADQLRETFGIRGVNFGKYVPQGERQSHLNRAFDAMHDLADVLGVPPRAMGLNGMLGLAFGAQGNGGKFAAHFVPGVNEINLTRNAGAGSLAHEWAHALDHYFGVQGGMASKEKPYASHIGARGTAGDLRSEIRTAIANIGSAMRSMEESEEQIRQRAAERVDEARRRQAAYLERNQVAEKVAGNAEAEAALARIMAGEQSEYVELPSRKRNKDYVPADVKTVADAAGFDAAQTVDMHDTVSSLGYALKDQRENFQKRLVHTSFYKSSQALDGKGKAYWSTPHEMFARSFEAFVLDRLMERGAQNDYLVSPVKRDQGATDPDYPYPAGLERAAINRGFDTLIGAIETRDTEAGVGLYRLGDGAGVSADEVAGALAAAPELAGIQVVQSFEDLPLAVRTRAERDGVAPDNLRGVFRPDGQYLVADNLGSLEEAVHTAVHEMVGHLGVRGVLGRELDATLERIYSSEAATTKGRQRIALIREVYAAPLSRRSAAGQRLMVAEEIIAHLAESGDQPGVLQRFMSKVRAMLRRRFPQVRWTYNDILGLIEQSRKWLQRERAASVNQAGDENLYSLTAEPDTRDALHKLGLAGEGAASMLDRVRNLTQADLKAVLGAWATRSREGLFDGLDGIRRAEEAVGVTDADQQGYVSARMASGIADVMHGVLHYGAPEWRDGVVSCKAGTRGVLEILGDLGPSNLNSWLGWLGGKRGQLLKAEGRENNLTDADIAELLAMANGKEALFERVYREYSQVNEAVLDLAEKAGLIDAEARAKWATEYYVPFYRQQEGDEGLFSAPRTKRGLSHQTAAIKALKGGKLPTNDLLGNMLAGWTKRIDAAMKNKALLEVVDNLKGSDYLADESPRYQQVLISRSQIAAQIRQDRKAQRLAAQMLGLKDGANTLKVLNELMKSQNEGFEKLWTRVAPTDPDIIRVQRAGMNEYYRVNDESLLRGLKFMAGSTFNDPITKIGRAFKRILTTGVTASPDFILRNFIRDAAHAWMINKDGFVLGKDSIRGMRDALREDQDYRDLMFAGGSFQGGYVHGTDPEASAQIIRRALEKKGFTREQQEAYLGSLVNTPAKAAAMLKMGWQKYRELGDKVENANRLSTYKAALAAGKSKRLAAFEAKDLMDYSLRGNFAAAQWFTDVVPFLNARLQGLYKLGRAVKGGKGLLAREVAMKGAYIALFSLLLAGLNDDDERYQALQDWDKDMHWHIFLGQEHFRIPKPFELGLVFGTIPERLLHALTGSQDGEDLAKAISHGVFQTLAFNPVPQFYQPIRELQANRNFFRDMPIEDMADEGKLPEARYDERTSALSRTLGQLTGPVAGLSPKQLDHLVMGYTGTLGGYVLAMSNMITGAFSDAPRPALNAGDVPVLKVLYQGDAVRSTQYQTEFYDMLQEAEQLHRTIRSYREEGKLEQAAMLLEASRDKLRHRPALGLARKQLGNIRQKMDRVYRDTGMDAAAKRVRLDDLQRQANGVAERVTRLAGGDF